MIGRKKGGLLNAGKIGGVSAEFTRKGKRNL
jgi:hypothetical protein